MKARGPTAAIILAGLTFCAAAATAADRPQRVTGTVVSVEQLPNLPGAKCGFHFDLTIDVLAEAPPVLLHVYDMGVRQDELVAFKGRRVEVDVVPGGIIKSIRPAGGIIRRVGALSELSTIKHC